MFRSFFENSINLLKKEKKVVQKLLKKNIDITLCFGCHDLREGCSKFGYIYYCFHYYKKFNECKEYQNKYKLKYKDKIRKEKLKILKKGLK